MAKMPVISLHMPWANWVAIGLKKIETRTHKRFASLKGKRIGIHASLKWDTSALGLAEPFLESWQAIRSKKCLRIGGRIVATAFVSDFRKLTVKDSRDALIDCGSTERYGLILTGVQIIKAIPAKGKQGIWYYDIPTGGTPDAPKP